MKSNSLPTLTNHGFGIGIFEPEHDSNYGTLFRTAQIFKADFIFLVGEKPIRQKTDTMNAVKNLPTFSFKNLHEFKKTMDENAEIEIILVEHISHLSHPEARVTPLHELKHPNMAVYLLGSEKSGLSRDAIKISNNMVYIPVPGIYHSLNVSVAGSIVLYDRFSKLK